MANYYSMIPGNYVKFVRATPSAWAKLTEKDMDTLYFISEKNSKNGTVYLGDKLMSDSSMSFSTLDSLIDITIDPLKLSENSMLVYDADEKTWVAVPAATVISGYVKLMVGATAEADGLGGIVPPPMAGQQNFFLRGDAKWANPTEAVEARVAALENTQVENGLYWAEF